MDHSPGKKYRAFISYSHTVSATLAASLESALRSYAKPIYTPPIRIFRDEKQMAAGLDLKASIRDALADSDYLIYIATREAAQSPYVREELDIWCRQLKRQDNLIIVWHKDRLQDDPLHDSILWEHSDALPEDLKAHIQGIPIWVDLTWAGNPGDLDLRNPRYKQVVNGIAARFRGVAPEVLLGDELRIHRRNIRIRNLGIAFLAVLLVTAVFAVTRALTERNQARINQLVYHAARVVDTDPTLALRFAVEADALNTGTPPLPIQHVLLQAFYRDDPETAWRYLVTFNHGSPLKNACFSPDQRMVLTTSFKGEVKVWTGAGNPLGTITQKHGAFGADISADSSLILTSGMMDETITVWNPNGSRFDSITVPLSEWPLARFSPTDNRVLIVSGEPYKTVRIWQPGDGSIVLGGNDPEYVQETCFTPDGKSILTLSSKIRGMIRRWTPEGKYRGYYKADSLGSGIQVSEDGRYLAAMGDPNTLNLFDLDTKQMTSRATSESPITTWSFSPRRDSIVAGTRTGRLLVWDLQGTLLLNGCPHDQAIRACSFSPDGRHLLSIAADDSARIWDLQGNLVGLCRKRETVIQAAEFSSDGQHVLTASSDGRARIWQPQHNAAVALESHGAAAEQAFFSGDSRNLIVRFANGTVLLWNVQTGPRDCDLTHRTDIGTLAVSPADGRIAGTHHGSADISLWNREGVFIGRLKGHSTSVRELRYAPTGDFLISTSTDQQVIVWNQEGVRPPGWKAREQEIASVRFSPDGSNAVALLKNSGIRHLNRNGEPRDNALTKKTGAVSVDFSVTGSYILCLFDNNSITVFDGSGVEQFTRPDEPIFWARFLPDESGLVTASASGRISIVNMRGEVTAHWQRPTESRYHSALISPDSQTVVVPQTGEIRDIHANLIGNIPVNSMIAFFPDSNFLLTATAKDENPSDIQIRNLNGRIVTSCASIATEAEVNTPQVVFSPDQRLMAILSTSGAKIRRTAAGILDYYNEEQLYTLTKDDLATYRIDWMR
jgi:WD40 repeat protein